MAAATCVDANTASTAAMIMGSGAVAWLEERACPARLVRVDGRSPVALARHDGRWPTDASPGRAAVTS